MNKNAFIELKAEMENELASILKWWTDNMIDDTNGGFYGKVDGQNQVYPEADKGVILNTRILWAFSAAANLTKNAQYEIIAHRAYKYLVKFFVDKKNGGLFWMLDYEGNPTHTKKQIYAIAFGIYGLSEYYRLTKTSDALNAAIELFDLIEKYSLDKKEDGYFEAFTEDWQPLDDLRLSEKDANEAKTMNTHLHILEAYTNLYRVSPSEKVGKALQSLIKCFISKFIDKESNHLHLFFDEAWNSKSSIISYGHDIECSWLLHEAAIVLGDDELLRMVKTIAVEMANTTLDKAFDSSGGIIYESEDAHFVYEKHWWVQAESMVGFYNAFELSQENKFFDASIKCWNFIKNNILDKENGEWHWGILENGKVPSSEDKAGAWKAPYHNGRMCMEIIERINYNQ